MFSSKPPPHERWLKRVPVVVAYLFTWLTIPHVLLHKKRPSSALAWIWAIIALPFLGPLAYWGFGADRVQRKRLRKARRHGLMRHPGQSALDEQLARVSPRNSELVRMLAVINSVPASTAHRVEMLLDASEFYPALRAAIDGARHHIHLEFFIWRDDPCGREFVEALASAARRGVEVRLLLDQIGCFGLGKSMFRPLIEAGGRFSWFYSLPLWRHSRFMNLRNHRKLQIIDGEIAFVGGMNMGQEYVQGLPGMGPWRDAQMRVEGNVVRHLQRLFAEDWFFATDQRFSGENYYPQPTPDEPHVVQIIAGGPDIPREPIPKSIFALLSGARQRVWLTTGYFAPNEFFLNGLQLCAARGVDVRVLISERTDHWYLVHVGRSYYKDLLEWGVRVYEYSEGINHKKTMLIDDDWLMIGSANSDNRSMRLNFELNLFAHAPREAARLERQLVQEFAISREIERRHLGRDWILKRLARASLRLLGPVL
jgi:cardiolipin synthase